MRIKNGFIIENTGEHYSVKSVSGNIQSGIFLSDIDLFLWRMLEKGDASKTDMLDALLEEFDISTVLALGNIDTFLKIMKEHGIIEE